MAPPPTPQLIRLTFAPVYFGNILAWLFFGFVGMQFYTYTTSRRNDSIWLKFLVYFVVLTVAANLGLETASGYETLVAGWGNETVIEKPPKPLILGPIFKAIVAFCVQNFYAWRIWAFLQRTIIASLFCGLIVSLSILQVIGGIGIPAAFFTVDVQAEIAAHTQVYNNLWLICGLANDIMITAAMVVILRDAKSRTITTRTKTLLGRLIRITVQTGAFTSLLAIATLILFFNISKVGLFQTFPAALLEPSYALSLLYNLNINVGQTNTSAFQSSFYIQPGSLHFNRGNDYGSHPQKLERTANAFELSLRSTRGDSVPVTSDASHIIIAKTGVKSTDYDMSGNHFESDGTSTRA